MLKENSDPKCQESPPTRVTSYTYLKPNLCPLTRILSERTVTPSLSEYSGMRHCALSDSDRPYGLQRCWRKQDLGTIDMHGITSHTTAVFNPLNAELNPICYLLTLLGAHHFLHVSRIRVKSLTLRLLMSYIYGAPSLDVSRSHTTTHHSR
jgi:hypothetical protein